MTTLAAIGWPVLDRIHIGSRFAISPHGLGIAIGFMLGAWWLLRESPRRGISADHMNSMIFWALIGAIVGARVFYVIAHLSEFHSVGDVLAIYNGGISLLGGIAGAILVNLPRMRKHGYRFFQVMDVAVIGLSFGIMVGRFGDLIIGDHLGKPTSVPWAFQYHGGTLSSPFECAVGVCKAALQDGQQMTVTHGLAILRSATGQILATGDGVHQTAMYDLVSSFALFLLLYALSRRSLRTGVLTLIFGAWYGTVRLVTDSLRIDKQFFGLTGSQWTALTVAAICVVTLIAWAARGRLGAPEEPESEEPEPQPAPESS